MLNVQKSIVWTNFKLLKGNLANQQTSFEMLLYLAVSSLSSQIMAGLPLSPLNSHSSESMGSSLSHFMFLCYLSFSVERKWKIEKKRQRGRQNETVLIKSYDNNYRKKYMKCHVKGLEMEQNDRQDRSCKIRGFIHLQFIGLWSKGSMHGKNKRVI